MPGNSTKSAKSIARQRATATDRVSHTPPLHTRYLSLLSSNNIRKEKKRQNRRERTDIVKFDK